MRVSFRPSSIPSEVCVQIGTVGTVAITIGWLIALLVLVLAILGLVGVLPQSSTVIFGLIAALAVARMV